MQTEADTLVVFNLSSTQSCKLLWKSCIEHHTFFRLIAPPTNPPKSLFSLGSRYRYRYLLLFDDRRCGALPCSPVVAPTAADQTNTALRRRAVRLRAQLVLPIEAGGVTDCCG